LTQKIKNK